MYKGTVFVSRDCTNFFQKRTHKRKPKVPYQEAQTAQEAIQKIIQEKRISSKINYDVLNDLTFNASSVKSSSNKGDNPGEVAAVSAAAAIHSVGPILENRASTLLRLKKVNSGAHLEVSVNHAGNLNLTLNAPIATKVICFSRLLKCFRSLYGKQCGLLL